MATPSALRAYCAWLHPLLSGPIARGYTLISGPIARGYTLCFKGLPWLASFKPPLALALRTWPLSASYGFSGPAVALVFHAEPLSFWFPGLSHFALLLP